jgi:hypothetical protein
MASKGSEDFAGTVNDEHKVPGKGDEGNVREAGSEIKEPSSDACTPPSKPLEQATITDEQDSSTRNSDSGKMSSSSRADGKSAVPKADKPSQAFYVNTKSSPGRKRGREFIEDEDQLAPDQSGNSAGKDAEAVRDNSCDHTIVSGPAKKRAIEASSGAVAEEKNNFHGLEQVCISC